MLELPIRIRRGTAPARPTTAWFLPGAATHLWIAELLRWETSQRDLTLRIVPSSTSDRRPRGLLVTWSGTALPEASSRCHPYGKFSERLFLPADAIVEPELTPREMQSLLAGNDAVYLWHPATGLVGFEAADALRLCDLLELPGHAPTNEWDQAQPGLHLAERLISVNPLEQVSIQDFLKNSGDDIGFQSTQLDELPPVAGEPKKSAVDRVKRGALTALARVASWFRQTPRDTPSQAPRDATAEPTQVRPGTTRRASGGGLGAWIRRRLSQMQSADLQDKRDRAIGRLIQMLEQAPDKGLRFALPFSGGGRFRGHAPPGSELGERPVDFSLSGLASGGPVDTWNVSHNAQQRLLELYRELANREMRLGRHRRAAFIFGNLLGDLHAAASVLKSGGHWREAAALYRDLIKSPAAAAGCLEEGGLWSEAIELFEELGNFERAGDLHRRLEQEKSAVEAYQRAVDRHVSNADFLNAARIQTDKLTDPQAAISLLARGWPTSPQARRCLEEIFRLRGQLGEHDAVAKQIARFAQQHRSQAQQAMFLDVLSRTATGYPDAGIQDVAKDTVRVLAGRSLLEVDAAGSKALLKSVQQLEPADRLLARDCNRYQNRLRGRSRRAPLREPQLVYEVPLDDTVDWSAAASWGKGYYLAGFRDRELIVARGWWDGSFQSRRLGQPRGRLEHAPSILLTIGPEESQEVWLHVPGCEPLEPVTFPATDQMPANHVGAPAWLRPGTVAVTNVDGFASTICEFEGKLVASFYERNQLVNSSQLQWPTEQRDTNELIALAPLPLFHRQSKSFVGLGRRLIVQDSTGAQATDLDATIRSITPIGDSRSGPLVIATESGVVLLWRPLNGPRTQHLAVELDEPVIGSTTNHWLLAADQSRLEAFEIDVAGQYVTSRGTYRPFPSKPIAFLATDTWDQIGVLLSDSRIQLYQLPASAAEVGRIAGILRSRSTPGNSDETQG